MGVAEVDLLPEPHGSPLDDLLKKLVADHHNGWGWRSRRRLVSDLSRVGITHENQLRWLVGMGSLAARIHGIGRQAIRQAKSLLEDIDAEQIGVRSP